MWKTPLREETSYDRRTASGRSHTRFMTVGTAYLFSTSFSAHADGERRGQNGIGGGSSERSRRDASLGAFRSIRVPRRSPSACSEVSKKSLRGGRDGVRERAAVPLDEPEHPLGVELRHQHLLGLFNISAHADGEHTPLPRTSDSLGYLKTRLAGSFPTLPSDPIFVIGT